MTTKAKNDYEKLVQQLINSMTITGVEDLGESPLVIQEYLERVTHVITDRYIHEHYDWLMFDSPMGRQSENYLELKLGLIAKWEGQTGHRGITIIYLPKGKYSCAEEVKATIDMLHTLKHHKEKLFDEYSKFEFFN